MELVVNDRKVALSSGVNSISFVYIKLFLGVECRGVDISGLETAGKWQLGSEVNMEKEAFNLKRWQSPDTFLLRFITHIYIYIPFFCSFLLMFPLSSFFFFSFTVTIFFLVSRIFTEEKMNK